VDDDDNQERQVSQTVADVLVDMLEQTGVKQIFGLIGDSLNPLADAIP
jgi:pyruvate dehydrogenase (quinone)